MRTEAIGQVVNSIGINNEGIKNKAIESGDNSFSKMIGDAIKGVNESQINADNKVQSFIKGEDVTMHDVMLSMQESQISMQLLIEVRNKVVEAYQEINRVQI